MYDRETVELALLALEEGMTQKEAAELCGASRSAVKHWAAGRLPHDRPAGRPGRQGARMVPAKARKEAPVNGSERATFEAAMMLASIYFSPFSPTFFRRFRQCDSADRANVFSPLSVSSRQSPFHRRPAPGP